MIRFALVFAAFIVLAAFSRLVPHPANFTPIIAMALLSGSVLRGHWLSYALPVFAMILSDAVIGFHSLSGVVYLSLIPAVWVGGWLSARRPEDQSWVRFLGGWVSLGFLADLSFFVLSNLGVWWIGGYYPRTFSGLVECFILALPFLLNQVAGTMTFLGLLLLSWYGLMVLARMQAPNYDPVKVRRSED